MRVTSADPPTYDVAYFRGSPEVLGLTPGPLEEVECGPLLPLSLADRILEGGPGGAWVERTLLEIPAPAQNLCVKRSIEACASVVGAATVDCPRGDGPDEILWIAGGLIGTRRGCVMTASPGRVIEAPAFEPVIDALSPRSFWGISSIVGDSLDYFAGVGGQLDQVALTRPLELTPLIRPTPELPEIAALDGDFYAGEEVAATTVNGGLLVYHPGQRCPGPCLGVPTSSNAPGCNAWCVWEPPGPEPKANPRVSWLAAGEVIVLTSEPFVLRLKDGVVTQEPLPGGGVAIAAADYHQRAIVVSRGDDGSELLIEKSVGGWAPQSPPVRLPAGITALHPGNELTTYVGLGGLVGRTGLCDPISVGPEDLNALSRDAQGGLAAGGRPQNPGQPPKLLLVKLN